VEREDVDVGSERGSKRVVSLIERMQARKDMHLLAGIFSLLPLMQRDACISCSVVVAHGTDSHINLRHDFDLW
jgi:hypothetical protein